MVLVVKNPSTSAGDVRVASSIPGSGRSPEGGDGNPLQYSCLVKEDPGGLRSIGLQSRTRLNWFNMKGSANTSI